MSTRADAAGAGGAARRSPKRERGRLLIRCPAPEGWRWGWSAGAPVRRCGCGSRIVVRSVAFSRCERGCVRLPAAPVPARPAPPPPQPQAPPPDCARLLRDLWILERDFVRGARKGRRPSARAVELALEAVGRLKALYPDHAESIAARLPWLERRAAVRERSA